MTVMSSYSGSELLEPEDGDWIHNVLCTKLFTQNTNIHYRQIKVTHYTGNCVGMSAQVPVYCNFSN